MRTSWGRKYCHSVLLLALIACSAGAPRGASDVSASDPGGLQVTGIVHRSAVEGGCWRFETSDGKSYELRASQAPTDLLVDGKRATLVLRLRPDLLSTCQVGQVADVVRVERT